MKVCKKCNEFKAYDLFHKNKAFKDGYQSKCKQCLNEISINYYYQNKEFTKKYKDINREKNKYKIQENKNKWRQQNKTLKPNYCSNYINTRRQKDYNFKFSLNVRSLISGAFRRGTNQYKKNAKTETILGCTIEEFRYYIAAQFKKGMSFDNHGEWHLDHIIPIATAKNQEDIIILNHYTNFQPLWAEQNFSKGDSIIETQLKLL
jgi:hypothetical protein